MTVTTSRRLAAICATIACFGLLTACGQGDQSESSSPSITIATHDSWAMDKSVMADFTQQTGIKVKIAKLGDAGEMTNKLILTKSAPIADGVFGLNNPLLVRALENGIMTEVDVDVPDSAYDEAKAIRTDLAAPIDFSDVCLNVDKAWFAAKGKPAPSGLADLTRPEYRGLFVTPGADTSSPGQAFLLATVAAEGKGWPAYWEKLMANDTKVVSGWTEAYETDFSAGSGQGTRPIVVSYSSSPPFTIPAGGEAPTTAALLDTCYRDVEYAGALQGSEKSAEVEEFVQFMLGRKFQQQLPEQMYVYPIDSAIKLPAAWAKWAPTAVDPLVLTEDELGDTPELVKAWREIVTR